MSTALMTTVLAQAQTEGNIPIWDNLILDQWEIPFGDWIDEIVDWTVANLGTVLDAIEWPFSLLFRNFVKGPEYHPWWEITDMSWVLVCGIVAVVGMLTRNLRVGLGLAVLLAICGLLGNEFWEETVTTIGLIVVAVVICAIIGIPLGVLCGRFDGVWKAVRPVLDAMQVVHAFVYIIPFIFFFGLGPEPATMVTMVFAIPPLIRLTNLGVRQVPADVVEASRAYGASELRVLIDVQIPLARPAIMTGINQTLLLAISMIGIAAIMGASGLGLLVFRAVVNLDIVLSFSAGLALFIVAVVLDRISQREDTDSANLLRRIGRAWAHRRDPEKLLVSEEKKTLRQESGADGRYAPVSRAERAWVWVALAGSLLGIVSVFLPWSLDSGLISGYSRASDLDLAESSLSGLAAAGGSFFGISVLAMSLLVLGSAANTLVRPGATRWFGADGALLFSVGGLASAVAYLWIDPNAEAAAHSYGIGVWLALAGGVIAAAGAALWIRIAPYSPLRPLPATVSISRIVTTVAIFGLVVAGGLSSWSIDSRVESVITPEIQAEIERLDKEGREDPTKAAQNAITITSLSEEAQRKNVVKTDGFEESGPGFGRLARWLGILGILFSLPAAGLGHPLGHLLDTLGRFLGRLGRLGRFLGRLLSRLGGFLSGGGERHRWMWSAAVSALGVGVTLVSAGWIASLVRASDPNFVSGPGAFLCLLAGFLLFASSRGVLREFRRAKVYAENTDSADQAGDCRGIEVDESVGLTT